jgi:hypothetical protein
MGMLDYLRIGAVVGAGILYIGCGTKGPDKVTVAQLRALNFTPQEDVVLDKLLGEELKGSKKFIRRYDPKGTFSPLDFSLKTGEAGVEYDLPFGLIVTRMSPDGHVDPFGVAERGKPLNIPDLNKDGYVGNPKRGIVGKDGGSVAIVGVRNADDRMLSKYVMYTDCMGSSMAVFEVTNPSKDSDPQGRQVMKKIR